MEDLHRLVGVEGRHDLGDRVDVAVKEVAEAAVVVDGAGPGAAAHEQLEARDAEGVLDVDGDKADPVGVLCRRPKPVLERPGLGLAGALLVRDAPDLPDRLRIEVRRDRQHEDLV